MSSHTTTRYSEYDRFARIHSETWGLELKQWVPEIAKLLKQHLPGEVPKLLQILDLCCGTGELAAGLQNLGYRVTGIDGSVEMLRYAHQNAPDSQFILDDARFFQLPSTFHGVISTNVSFNHILELEDLTRVLCNVYNALLPDGVFIFDLRLDASYRSSWQDTVLGDIKDDCVWTLLRSYNLETRIGQIEIAILELLQQKWQRSNITWSVKGYFQDEVYSALEEAGFRNISVYDAERDFQHPRGIGVVYFICRK
ncbi:class I SAM-dependent methyltransferase [Myxosarcina sp. GI1]|uniref:class I SAM-dependent DNA methyltransferase n=1 Tax=Myxosarcina sp. GI1 TaxID=1541065 RepID=UPI000560752B|nr:class I SAM-dependent methyltransferase [Myxosarcina sp. GI1]